MFSLGWAGLYVGGALLVTAAVLVFANRLYGEDQAYRPVRPAMATVVGALWPVLVIGAAQLLVLHVLRRHARSRDAAVIALDPGRRAALPGPGIPTWRISA
ncbi:MAG: hypothetical protein H6522_12335 [Mycolicibacterium sp.]|jgi:hypothetical protein|nr:hypothetical protein [Mycolicibacterium sp.]